MGIIEFEYPPYSPDLAPCDFYSFPKPKKYLSGLHFDSIAALGSAIFQYMKQTPPKEYYVIRVLGSYYLWYMSLECMVVTICGNLNEL